MSGRMTSKHMKLFQHKIASPLGAILLITDEQGRVRALDFDDHPAHLKRLLQEHYGDYDLAEAQQKSDVEPKLQRYFSGELHALDSVTVAADGSAFRQQVWAALRKIPPGQVVSYGELASRLGKPKAAREVGGANAANPIAIIVPCHRVVAWDGNLRGFAWGLERKRWLLAHEGADPRRNRTSNTSRLDGF